MSAETGVVVGDVMAAKTGSVDPAKFPDEVFDLYSVPAFDSRTPEIVAGSSIGSSKQIVQPGDVLLSKIVPHIRRAWVVGEARGRRLIASGEWIVFRSDKIDPNYVRHVVIGDPFHAEFMRTVSGVGGSLLRARPSQVAKIRIPLPCLTEQRRIAAILDQADALRAKRREALAHLDTLTQSIFIEMFGDPRSNEKRWPTTRIGSLVSEMRGGAPLEPEDFVDEGFPILHKGAIKPLGEIRIDARKKTFALAEYASNRPNSIAERHHIAVTLRDLVPSGPSIGMAADLRNGPFDKYLLAQGAYAFRIDSNTATPAFFVQLSNMPTFRHVLRQNAVGSTQIHIRTPIYLAIEMPMPPIELQQKFADKVHGVEALRRKYRDSLTELDTLFASVQHCAFSGEL